jgi:hypothetical protein
MNFTLVTSLKSSEVLHALAQRLASAVRAMPCPFSPSIGTSKRRRIRTSPSASLCFADPLLLTPRCKTMTSKHAWRCTLRPASSVSYRSASKRTEFVLPPPLILGDLKIDVPVVVSPMAGYCIAFSEVTRCMHVCVVR